MPHHLRSYQPDQPPLLPPSFRDWLPEDNRVNTMSEIVDARDLATHPTFGRRKGICPLNRYNGEGLSLRLYHGGIVIPATGSETEGGCGDPRTGVGKSTAE